MSAALSRDGALAPVAPMTAAVRGLAAPGSRTAAVDPAELAGLLRGEARVCDGAALALGVRLGFPAADFLAALPAIRAAARRASPSRSVGA